MVTTQVDGKIPVQILNKTLPCRIRFQNRTAQFDINELECPALAGGTGTKRVSGLAIETDQYEIKRNGQTITRGTGFFHLAPPLRKVPNPITWLLPVPVPIPKWGNAKDTLNDMIECGASIIGSEKFNEKILSKADEWHFTGYENIRRKLSKMCGKKDCNPALFITAPMKDHGEAIDVVELHCDPHTANCDEEIVFSSPNGWNCDIMKHTETGVRTVPPRILGINDPDPEPAVCNKLLAGLYYSEAGTRCYKRPEGEKL